MMKKGNPPICPYCKFSSSLVTGDVIYPHRPDLSNLKFYLCKPCNAYVGTHRGTMKPLGTLANAELRLARANTHEAFDPLWQSSQFTRRKDAYFWLSQQLDIQPHECHIGVFDLTMCKRAIEVCSNE